MSNGGNAPPDRVEMIMSTITLAGARLVATAFDTEHPVIEARLRRGEAHARPFLARLTDADLTTLGFSPGEIAAIRTAPGGPDLIRL